MRSYLKSFLICFFIFLGLILGLDCLLKLYEEDKLNFKVRESATIAILGNSHPEVAVNDSLISGSINLASQGESYFYTYQKAKQVLKQNDQLKTILIEVTTSGEPINCNAWMWDHQHIKNKYAKFIPVMNWSDKTLLARVNPEAFLMSYSISMKNQLERLIRRDYDFRDGLGGFYFSKDCLIDSLLKVNPNKRTAVYEPSTNFSYNFYFLKKLVDLCEESGRQVILFRSPLHPMSAQYGEPNTLPKEIDLLTGHKPFLNFSSFPLSNEDFADLDHTNNRGAAKFSMWLQQLINKGLLRKTDVEIFANEELQNEISRIKSL